MTQQELDALKALADAATPGPWEEVAESGEWWMTTATDEDGSLYVIPDTANMNQADVDFIAASRTAVPALLAEVERLQVAWSAEHDAYIRADEQARMARREVERLRAELAAARNLTMDVRRADNGDIVIGVE
jgi:hypothetical protein